MIRIAIIDDDEELVAYFKALVESAGYVPVVYCSAGAFMDSLSAGLPDLVILDLQMPGVNGWDLIRVLRGKPETKPIPIVVVSGEFRKAEDMVRTLGDGADEHLTKPVDKDLFLTRIEALLRRSAWAAGFTRDPSDVLRLGPLTIDVAGRSVQLQRQELVLTHLEFDLLLYLARNRNRVLSRSLLLEQVWKTDPTQDTRTVDKRVEVLRKKLGKFGDNIQTHSGVGYCLRLA